MNFAFVPVYIKFLGIEAYGLISIFALLQAWLVVLDMGMRPALGREMARFSGGAHDPQSIRNLLRSIEAFGATAAALIALGIWSASRWLAADWLRVEKLPVAMVAHAFGIMGVVTALRFLEDMYANCLAGLELQVTQNTVICVMATLRCLGAVATLAWISRSIDAFFIWQGLVSLATVAVFALAVYRALPEGPMSGHFSVGALFSVWHFAAGMMAITCLSLLLTQSDKILLSRILTLHDYGYYALAAALTNGLVSLAAPITAAFYPRFTTLTTIGNERGVRQAYHQGAQLVTVVTGSAAVVLILFRDAVILGWTGDPSIVPEVAPLTAVLAVGTLLNTLASIPYQMMLANGWTRLPVKINLVAVILLVPAILWTVPQYGAIGAACIWVLLNASYVVIAVSLMHRRLLPNEKWNWYCQDVAVPLFSAIIAGAACRAALPDRGSRIADLGIVAASAGCILLASALSASAIRHQILSKLAPLSACVGPRATPAGTTESHQR